MVKEFITPLISEKKKIDTVNKTEKSQASNKTVDKSRFILRSNYSNKSTRIENSSEIHIHKDNLSVSVLSGQEKSLSSVTPDNICIFRNNKRKKTPDTLIIRKQPIQEPFNTRKRAKENTLTDVKQLVLKKHLQLFVIR